MAWPNQNPSSNANGGLLVSLLLARGVTNAATLPWQALIEATLANLIIDGAPQVGFSSFQRTLTALGTAQNTTPTAAQTIGGILTQTSATGAGTATFPTGAILSAAFPVPPSAGASFQCLYVNLGGGQTVTITAGASGMTVVGTAAVPTAKACLLTFVCTAADTWTVYCNLSA